MSGKPKTPAQLNKRAIGQVGAKSAQMVHPRISSGDTVVSVDVSRHYTVAVDNPFWKKSLPVSGIVLPLLQLGSLDGATDANKIGGLGVIKFSLDNLVAMSRYASGKTTMYTDAYCSSLTVRIGKTGPVGSRSGTLGVATYPLGLHEASLDAPDSNGGLNWIINSPNGRITSSGSKVTSSFRVTQHDAAFLWQPLGQAEANDMLEFVVAICYYDLAHTEAEIKADVAVNPPSGCFGMDIKARIHLKGFAKRTLNPSPKSKLTEAHVYVENPDGTKFGDGILLRESEYLRLRERETDKPGTIRRVVASIAVDGTYDSDDSYDADLAMDDMS